MNAKNWLKVFIIYILVGFGVVITTFYIGFVLLQMPLWYVTILAGLTLLATTIGIAVGLFLALRGKR
jgi:ABC-type multidrug transport system permease subunit